MYQCIVQERIQSALIIEYDVDWGILLKPQMLSFARGVQALQDSALPLHSPYADSWNVPILGQIGVNNKSNRLQQYCVTPNGPTVISEPRCAWTRKPDLSAEKLKGNHTRLVMEINRFTGTSACGVSLRGAARLLYDQPMLPNAWAIDMIMAAVCRRDNTWNEPFCFGAYPMLFVLFRAIGVLDKDSDRHSSTDKDQRGLNRV